MFVNRSCALASAVAVVAGFAGSALAFVPWSNPNGSATNFMWANGGSDNGLFGDPTLVGSNLLLFNPRFFRAEGVNGSSQTTSDRMVFDLIANTGFEISGLRIEEFGDYGVFGAAGASAGVSGNLLMTNLNTAAQQSDSLSVAPGPIILSGSGNWTADADVSLPSGWTYLRVELFNDLIAISVPGSVVFIEKKVVGGAVGIRIIPTPGAASVLALGGLAAFRRRR